MSVRRGGEDYNHNQMNQVLEQFTELIQSRIAESESEEAGSLADKEQRLSALVLYDLIFLLNHAKK